MADLSVAVQESLRVLDFVYGAVRAPGLASGLMASGPPALRLSDAVTASLNLAVSVQENFQIEERVFGAARGPNVLSSGLEEIFHVSQGGQVDLTDLLAPRLRLSDIVTAILGIDFDAVSTSGVQVASGSYSWNHTTTTDADRALVVKISLLSGLGSTVTSVKYNGTDLALIRADTNGVFRTELWGMAAPASGTHAIDVVLSGSVTSSGAATSYAGVDQSSTFEANHGATGSNTPASDSVTPVTSGAWVVGGLTASSASGVSSDAGQRNRADTHGATGSELLDDEGAIVPAAPTTLLWNGLGALDTWAVSLVALSPVRAAATGDISANVTENLKVSDALNATLDPENAAPAPENIKISDSATPALQLAVKADDENAKIADVVSAAVSVTGQAQNENLKLSDSVQAALQLAAAAGAENLKLSDAATPALEVSFAGNDENLSIVDQDPTGNLAASVQCDDENLKLSDGPALAAIDVSFIASGENLKLSDAVTGPTIDPEQASGIDENLKIADTVSAVLSINGQGADENLKISDSATPAMQLAVRADDENLHVTDAPTPALQLAAVAGSENLKVSDSATTALQLAAQVGNENIKILDVLPEAVQASDENLKISDTVTAAVQLAASAGTENVHVVDQAPIAQLGFRIPLGDENLKISDTVVAAVQLAVTVDAENLKVSDAVVNSADLSVAVGNESLKIADTPAAALQLAAQADDESVHVTETIGRVALEVSGQPADEAVHVTDAVVVALQLAVQPDDENAKIADAPQMSVDLSAAATESLHVTDAATPALQLAASAGSENVHVTESATPTLVLAARADDENIKVSDVATPALQLAIEGDPPEPVHIVEHKLQVYIGALISGTAPDENVHVTDVVTPALQLAVSLSENMRIAEPRAIPFRSLRTVQASPNSLYVPRTTPIVDPMRLTKKDGRELAPEIALTSPWDAFFRTLRDMVTAATVATATVSAELQSAAILTTTIATPDRQEGLFRLTARLRQRQAATTSSTMVLTLSWTDVDGVVSTATLTLNSNVLGDQVTTLALIEPDPSNPITYAVTYASVGATPAVYDLDIVLESIPA